MVENKEEKLIPKWTIARISGYALHTIRRFAIIHGWSFNGLMENLAKSMREAIDGLETDDLRLLKTNYAYSELAVIPDVRELKNAQIEGACMSFWELPGIQFHFPFQTGFLFSRNALRPSTASSVLMSEPK